MTGMIHAVSHSFMITGFVFVMMLVIEYLGGPAVCLSDRFDPGVGAASCLRHALCEESDSVRDPRGQLNSAGRTRHAADACALETRVPGNQVGESRRQVCCGKLMAVIAEMISVGGSQDADVRI